MDRDDVQFLAVFALMVVLGLAFTFGCISAVYAGVSRPSCYATWRDSEFQARWSFWGGCQLSRDGRIWAPADVYVATQRNVQVQQ